MRGRGTEGHPLEVVAEGARGFVPSPLRRIEGILDGKKSSTNPQKEPWTMELPHFIGAATATVN